MSASSLLNPLPLSAYYVGSFAYKTIKDRLPIILTKAVDGLYRDKDSVEGKYGKGSREELKQVIGRFSKLRNEMQTDKPLVPIEDDSEDSAQWNSYLENLETIEPGVIRTWFSSPWLFVECYMYRRMYEAFQLSSSLKSYDPFREQKESSFMSSIDAEVILAKHLEEVIKTSKGKEKTDLFGNFYEFIELDLWGNKCDLSISSGVDNSQKLDPLKQLEPLRGNILVDDTRKLWDCILQAGKSPVALSIILDNAGFELFSDLCLADFLTATGLVQRVDFYVKTMPWYVSDTTRHDFEWMLSTMRSVPREPMADLASRWTSLLEKGTWAIKSNCFWTLPHDFSEMKSSNKNLYETLAKYDVVILKGDLNYRKLTGDRQWDHTVGFDVSLKGFHPAPLCTLRTLKCDVVVGLKPGQAEEIEKQKQDWQFTGSYAVVQFCSLKS